MPGANILRVWHNHKDPTWKLYCDKARPMRRKVVEVVERRRNMGGIWEENRRNDRLNLTSSFILPGLMGDKRCEAKVG